MPQTLIANLIVFLPPFVFAVIMFLVETTREMRNSPKAILARQGRR